MNKKETWYKKYTCEKLCEYHHEQFDEWWDPDLYDYKNYSYNLTVYCAKYINKWLHKDRYNWAEASWALAYYCTDYFDVWWDPARFDWENTSCFLAHYCSHKFSDSQLKELLNHHHINAREFAAAELEKRKQRKMTKSEWLSEYSGEHLCKFYSYKFKSWWDPDKWDWDNCSYWLIAYCHHRFKEWWDPDKFDWTYVSALKDYCEYDFSESQLNELLDHPNPKAKQFAEEVIERRKREKRRVV